MSDRKEVVILRGVSGAGKSTASKQLLGTLAPEESAIVVSADHYFERTGKYQFNPNELPMAHMSAQKKFEQALQQGTNLIIVDNTNIKMWEMKPYVAMAEKYSYNWRILQIEAANPQNVHGVPMEKVAQMQAKLQAETDKLPADWKARLTIIKR